MLLRTLCSIFGWYSSYTLLPPQSLVSGGVDSAVCTALLLAALGPDRVIAVHIDNGFMRKGESEEVKHSFKNLGLNLHGSTLSMLPYPLPVPQAPPCSVQLPSSPTVYSAAQRFYTARTVLSVCTDAGVEEKVTLPLQAVSSPEEKRAIIGNTFMRVWLTRTCRAA